MSLLLGSGHPEARDYPIGMLWDEAQFVVERINGQAVTSATLLQLAVGSLFSKEASKEFKKTISGLNNGQGRR